MGLDYYPHNFLRWYRHLLDSSGCCRVFYSSVDLQARMVGKVVMRMRYIPVLLLMVALLMSCSHARRKSVEPFQYPRRDRVELVDSKVDTIRIDEGAKKAERTAGASGSYSSDDDEEEYDNMRGFDPASEDDMDDNGVGRYTENTDEEGWD